MLGKKSPTAVRSLQVVYCTTRHAPGGAVLQAVSCLSGHLLTGPALTDYSTGHNQSGHPAQSNAAPAMPMANGSEMSEVP